MANIPGRGYVPMKAFLERHLRSQFRFHDAKYSQMMTQDQHQQHGMYSNQINERKASSRMPDPRSPDTSPSSIAKSPLTSPPRAPSLHSCDVLQADSLLSSPLSADARLHAAEKSSDTSMLARPQQPPQSPDSAAMMDTVPMFSAHLPTSQSTSPAASSTLSDSQPATSPSTDPCPPLITPVSLYGKRTQYSILEYDPLLDSSCMNVREDVRSSIASSY